MNVGLVSEASAHVLGWETRALAHMATLGPDGSPHSTPVWFDWDGEVLRMALYNDGQKLVNLRRDPRVSVSVVDPSNIYQFVEIRGVATSFEPDEELVFMTRMAGKYLGLDHYPWHQEGESFTVVNIQPTRIVEKRG